MFLIDDSWAFTFAALGAIGSVATAIALLFLWRQSNQTQQQIGLTQQEMDNTLRPWIGFRMIEKSSNKYVICHCRNYGRIPAKVISVTMAFDTVRFSRDHLHSLEPRSYQSVIFPDAEMMIEGKIPDQMKEFEYLGVSVEYEYSETKKGKYGLISRYDPVKNIFDYEDVFVS